MAEVAEEAAKFSNLANAFAIAGERKAAVI
jgi:hypothetical protein